MKEDIPAVGSSGPRFDAWAKVRCEEKYAMGGYEPGMLWAGGKRAGSRKHADRSQADIRYLEKSRQHGYKDGSAHHGYSGISGLSPESGRKSDASAVRQI
jgi:hypothetical protein